MAQRIVYPVLNIYLGTSPIIVGRYISRELRRLPDTDQRKVASLFIDTMPIQEERINGHRTYGSDTMQILIPRYQRSALEDAYQRSLNGGANGGANGSANGTSEARLQYDSLYITNNGHKAQHKPGISAAGAGGIRNNGHVAFCSWATSVQQSISDKLDLINSPPPVVQDERAAASLRVNIIAFLGGGTGSGVLPALTMLTRYVLMRKNVVPQTAIYAVLPEQPKGATEDMRRRQRSNAYSTLLELTTLMQLKQHQQRINYYFGTLKLDIAAMQIVDVVYLYGHGKLTDHSEIYEHIGMDIFTRMQDGHGAGHERLRQLPDLSGLQESDDRGLPTCVATSGVTEIIFPRQELLGALARRASRQVLATQINDLSAEERILTEKVSSDLAATLLNRLQKSIDEVQARLRPEPLEADVIEQGEEWWSQVEERLTQYRRALRFSRAEIVSALKTEFAEQVQTHARASRSAVFARYLYIYTGTQEALRQRMTNLPVVSRSSRDMEWEDRMLFPPRFRRRQPGRFAQYANEMLEAELSFANYENLREALRELSEWLSHEVDLRGQQFRQFRLAGTGGDSREDQQQLDEGRLPQPHKYTRMALPSGELVKQLNLFLLRQVGLEKDGQLHVTQVLEELQSQQRDQTIDLSAGMLEQFFLERFQRVIEHTTLLDIVLQFGGEDLLRHHLRWGMEWARAHLHYHPYQESRTNGRIARQLDVAMMLGGEGGLVRQIINEETPRSEVQNGLKLLNSLDPDRITLLYSEYAIPVRAIDGMHEPNDSYLADYLYSQHAWMLNGSMPTHTSTVLQEQVGRHHLVAAFADEHDGMDFGGLYGHSGNGSQPL